MTERDQRALRLGAWAIGILAVLYVILWRVETHQARRAQLTELSQQLVAMETRATATSARTPSAMSPTDVALRLQQALEESALDAQLVSLDGAWSVELESAPINAVISLDRRLTRDGLSVSQYRLEQASSPGFVTGRLEWQAVSP
jgi:type II secretory pathway component PulM